MGLLRPGPARTMRRMPRIDRTLWLLCAAALALGACSSGGGGGGGSAVTPQRLPVALRGATYPAMAATYQVFGAVTGEYAVLRDMDDPAGRTTITTSPTGESFILSVNETLGYGGRVTVDQPLTPPASELSYMSFGEWMRPMGERAFEGGFFAFGALTPASAVPTTGSATFTGGFRARAIEGGAVILTTTIDGSLSAVADFSARRVSVSTSNPVDPRFNFSGTLSYAPGENALRGSFSTPSDGSRMGYSGGAVARFYGPEAQELGGAFHLTRPNPVCVFSCVWSHDSYVGSFGAKR